MILARIKLWAAAIGAAILAVLALMAKSRRDGRLRERTIAQENDRERANQIRDAVDAARRGGGLQPDDRGYRD
jgi:HAMP domain-containing protein